MHDAEKRIVSLRHDILFLETEFKKVESTRADVWDADSEVFGEKYLEGVSAECLNSVDLREWLRNSPAKKPMYADPTKLEDTDGLYRGMPYLALSEDQIDQLLAYLLERK